MGQLQRGHFPGEASARGSKINILLLPKVASELYNTMLIAALSNKSIEPTHCSISRNKCFHCI